MIGGRNRWPEATRAPRHRRQHARQALRIRSAPTTAITRTPTAYFRSLLMQRASNGNITLIDLRPQNVARLLTDGLDVTLVMEISLLDGSLNLSGNATSVFILKRTPSPGVASVELAGFLMGVQKTRLNISASYEHSGRSIGILVNNSSSYRQRFEASDGSTGFRNTKSWTTVDVNLSRQIVDHNFEVGISIKNIFDKTPPFVNQG